ncbi:hypothetical protein BKA70DRAFT_1473817 [Coprinopsis sp. MPI-PUGE-AT-0042]|nr:hypothetical protein BKA70DRAFT_1473817 [Coprinopsis sp. MPI-PUGE-AT-0042]
MDPRKVKVEAEKKVSRSLASNIICDPNIAFKDIYTRALPDRSPVPLYMQLKEDRDALLEENWKLKLRINHLETERDAFAEWSIRDSEEHNRAKKEEFDSSLLAQQAFPLPASHPKILASLQDQQHGSGEDLSTYGENKDQVPPTINVRESQEYIDLQNKFLEMETSNTRHANQILDLEKRLDHQKEIQCQSDRNARQEVHKTYEKLQQSDAEKAKLLEKMEILEQQVREAEYLKERYNILEIASDELAAKWVQSERDHLGLAREKTKLKQDITTLKRDYLEACVARNEKHLKEVQRLRTWEWEDYQAYIANDLSSGGPLQQRLRPLCTVGQFAGFLRLLRDEEAWNRLTPRFVYDLDEHGWKFCNEFKERAGGIVEVCYSEGEKVFWAGRYRCHVLKEKNPGGYKGDQAQVVGSSSVALMIKSYTDYATPRKAAASLAQASILPRKPGDADQAKERADLRRQLQHMYKDGVLPVDCMVFEYMGHNPVLENLFRTCTRTVAAGTVIVQAGRVRKADELLEGSSHTFISSGTGEGGEEHSREAKKQRR